MLIPELIIKGPVVNYSNASEENRVTGKYIIDSQKQKRPDNVFCVDGVTNQILTSGQFVNDALKLAHVLRKLGVQKGDVVSIVTENSLQFVVIFGAILYIGAIINPLNPGYSIGELKHAFDISKPKVVLCSMTAIENVKRAKSDNIVLIETTPEQASLIGVDTLKTLLNLVVIDVDDVEPADFVDKHQTAMILLSSGTTGLPKGVMITYENFRHPLNYINDPDLVGLSPEHVLVGVLPFFHILGLCAVAVTAIYSSKLIILPSFQPEAFLRCVQQHKVTTSFVVPQIIGFLAKHPVVKKFDISTLTTLICSGGYLGKEIQEQFNDAHPYTTIILAYGITEMTGAITIASKSDSDKQGSVGRLVPGIEAMVWSADLGRNLAAGEVGELCFKGPTVMKGYIGRESNDIDQHGFYHTGDTGYYDESGCFYIKGRIKELIKYKGFQVPPAELEDLLLKHPAVKDCGVIGIPDEKAGQLPTALVVCQSDASVTADDIIDFVAERISAQKRLYGGVKFVEAIPRNAAGKILRDKLLELYKTL